MTTEFHKGTFDEFIALLAKRAADDNDNVLAIDGYEGTGKSTLAFQLARALDPTMPVEHVIFDWSEWDDVFSYSKKAQAYILDEGGNLALSRDAMTAPQKELIRILTQCRQLNDTLIFCMPSFYWLDKYVREHRVKWWLHVEKRGQATVLERVNDWRKGETWFEDTNSVFIFKSLEAVDATYAQEYRDHKKRAFLDRFDPKIVEDLPPEALFDFDNVQGRTGKRRKKKEGKPFGVPSVDVQA